MAARVNRPIKPFTWKATRQWRRLTDETPTSEDVSMTVDYLNAAMGLMFLAVWAMIWQFATNEA